MHFIAFSVLVLVLSVEASIVSHEKNLKNNARVKFDLYPNVHIFETFDFTMDLADSVLFKGFDPTIPTHFYIHGFQGKPETAEKYCDKLVTIGDFNCIAVDWSSYADNVNYALVKFGLNQVAKEVSDLIKILIMMGLKLDDLTLIGHSLGAHLSGRIAQYLERIDKVGTIIGLDPAGPLFPSKSGYQPEHLVKSDAKYVLVLHTDVRQYGMKQAIGHADVYVNWGLRQPGCRHLWWPYNDSLHPCSHSRAHELFFESLTTNFKAIQCSILRKSKKECVFKDFKTIMGPNMTKAHGLFYLETKGEAPFLKATWFDNIRFIEPSDIYVTLLS